MYIGAGFQCATGLRDPDAHPEDLQQVQGDEIGFRLLQGQEQTRRHVLPGMQLPPQHHCARLTLGNDIRDLEPILQYPTE